MVHLLYADEDDLFSVFSYLSSLYSRWYNLCLALGVSPTLLESIKKDHSSDTETCLHEGLLYWLWRSYSINKHGFPTWRKLVEAVDHPFGGGDPALALKIAKEHKS